MKNEKRRVKTNNPRILRGACRVARKEKWTPKQLEQQIKKMVEVSVYTTDFKILKPNWMIEDELRKRGLL